jgi:hypothetical protein
MDTVKSIVGTVQAQLTDQASLIYDQVKSAITTKLDKVMPKKMETPQEPKEEPAKQKPADSFDSPPTEDPDNVSFSRILDKVWYYIQKFIYPLLCVLMASFIANEMIMYAPIIRFTFFTFFLLICLSSTGILSSMCVYYLLKLLYGVYVNKMTDRPKIKLLPTVYSMLPLIVNRPLLPIAALFLYPFTYPKTQVDEKALLETMVLYQKDLDRSYPAVSADVMPDKVTKAKEYLKHMHDTPKQTEQKGYIGELSKIVADPSKFHAPIGQMQIEAAKKAKEGAEVAGAAAAVAQQLGIKPVTFFAPQGVDQDITNAISSLKRTIRSNKDDEDNTLKKIEKYGKIRNALTKEQKSEIEKRGYIFNDDKGFILPMSKPSTTSRDLSEVAQPAAAPISTVNLQTLPPSSTYPVPLVSGYAQAPSGVDSSVSRAPVSTLPPVIASTQQASAPPLQQLPSSIELVKTGVKDVNTTNTRGTFTMPSQVDASGEAESEETTLPSETVRTKHGDLSLQSNPLKSMMNELFDKNGHRINASGKRITISDAQRAQFEKETAEQTAKGKAAHEKFLRE